MNGPGKYDEHATRVREETGAQSVVVIVIGGNKGHGFSHQMQVPTDSTKDAHILSLRMCIDVLGQVAVGMKRELQRLRGN